MSPENTDPFDAARKVRIAMIERGWRAADLAKALNLKPQHLRNILSGDDASKFGRRKMEVLFQRSFWSTPQEYLAAERVTAVIGFDPVLCDMALLRRAASELRVAHDALGRLQRPSLIATLDAYFRAVPPEGPLPIPLKCAPCRAESPSRCHREGTEKVAAAARAAVTHAREQTSNFAAAAQHAVVRARE